MKTIHIFLLATLTLLLCLPARAAEVNIPGGVRAISKGQGTIQLFWYPPRGIWPEGGFRILDGAGRTIEERIVPFSNIPHDGSLNATDQALLDQLSKRPGLLSSSKSEDQKQTQLLLVLKSATSPAMARVLGLSSTIKAVGNGEKSYTVIGLDASGKPGGLSMKCTAIDATVASALPPAPLEAAAQMNSTGVELYWLKAAAKENETAFYEVERSNKGGEYIKITEKPLLISSSSEQSQLPPQYMDSSAPQEQTVSYRIFGVDLFGRRSLPAEISLFVPAFATLLPPQGISAEAKVEAIQLSWLDEQRPTSTRYLIERAPTAGGPYQVLTQEGIKAAAKYFLDKTVQDGGTYYYRMRTARSDGQLSHPSEPVSIQFLSGQPPAAVRDLKADLGIRTVHLTWSAQDRSVAGYLVERQQGKEWQRVNETVWTDNSLDDPYSADQELSMTYRVRAVGRNNKIAEPGPAVTVKIRKEPRGVPEIIQADAGPNGISIRFIFPQERSDLKFVIRRGASKQEEGMIISPVLTCKEMRFTDTRVAPGNHYFYRISAFTATGWTSALSPAIPVSIHADALPVPQQPTAEFASKPFTHVKIIFGKIPDNLRVIVERKSAFATYWETLKGEGSEEGFIDANPPAGDSVAYRLRYLAADGTPGEPSQPMTVMKKQ